MLWIVNLIRAAAEKPIRRRPAGLVLPNDIQNVMWAAEYRGEKHPDIPFTFDDLTEERIYDVSKPLADYINHRYDCSDFRLLSLLKLRLTVPEYFEEHEKLDSLYKDTFLGFKFWLKSPGDDSMCYYTENHGLSFAVIEYILGSMYPDEIFGIDGENGRTHTETAEKRIRIWFELRKKYGYSEFYSNNYLPINLAILSMLIRYGGNAELSSLAADAVNDILYDYASTIFDNSFVNASGRAYPRNNMNAAYSEPNSDMVIEAVWGSSEKTKMFVGHTSWLFTSMMLAKDKDGKPFYTVPENIYKLGLEKETEVKKTFGLALKDYKKEGLYGTDDRSIMMQFGSGALTNPEIISNTYDVVHKYSLWKNDFLSWLRIIESPLSRVIGLMPFWSKVFNYFMNGMSLGIADVYTHRTEHWKISCAQNYEPGSSGAQETLMAVTLPRGVTVYTNHPLRVDNPKTKGVQFDGDRSPSYFGGYGIAPCSYADGNVCLISYRIPLFRRAFAPFKMLHFSHTFFPEELFDKTIVEGRYAFAECGGSYIALTGRNSLEYQEFNPRLAASAQGRLKDEKLHFDLVQKGRKTYWIYELSDSSKESFEEFMERIKSNTVSFSGKVLEYKTDKTYRVTYGEKFEIDGVPCDTCYRK